MSLTQGTGAMTTVTTAVATGTAETVSFSVSGLPSGATATFSPTSTTAGGSTTMSITTTTSVPVGTYPLFVSGLTPSAGHSVGVTLTVLPQASDFSLAAAPPSVNAAVNADGTTSVQTTAIGGAPESVALTVSAGLPTGATATFSPTSVTAGQASSLTLHAGASTVPGTYHLTVKGVATSATHTMNLDFIVTSVASDFTISVDPSTASAQHGTPVMATVSTGVAAGVAESLTLSISGQPSGVTGSFDNTNLTSGQSATLTLTADSTASAGTYPITITGTGSTGTHTTTLTFTVIGDDFSIDVPALSVAIGGKKVLNLTSMVTSGSAQSVDLTVDGLPDGVTATFDPSTINAGDKSLITLFAKGSAKAGDYTVMVTATGASATHTSSVKLSVTNTSSDSAQPGDTSGCGCTVGGESHAGGGAAGAVMASMLGLAFVWRRRRR
jgi:MYXO-CTERM domain-containing protein